VYVCFVASVSWLLCAVRSVSKTLARAIHIYGRKGSDPPLARSPMYCHCFLTLAGGGGSCWRLRLTRVNPVGCLWRVCLLCGFSLVSSVCCEERLENASARNTYMGHPPLARSPMYGLTLGRSYVPIVCFKAVCFCWCIPAASRAAAPLRINESEPWVSFNWIGLTLDSLFVYAWRLCVFVGVHLLHPWLQRRA